jgi:signal transduction histidine kinase
MPYRLRDNEDRMPSAGSALAGIEERVRELGGTMKVEQDADATRVEVLLPVMEARDAATASSTGGGRSRSRPT